MNETTVLLIDSIHGQRSISMSATDEGRRISSNGGYTLFKLKTVVQEWASENHVKYEVFNDGWDFYVRFFDPTDAVDFRLRFS